MSGELIAILGVGAAVAGIVLNGQRNTRQEILGLRLEMKQELVSLRQEMKQDIAALRADIEKRLDGLDGRLRAVEHGQAKLEGLLEGLREAIAGRKDAA